VLIEYSGINDTCDGLLSYDKQTEAITVERASADEGDVSLRWLFGSIHLLLDKKEITSQKRRICVG
jgi:hypothetical protein